MSDTFINSSTCNNMWPAVVFLRVLSSKFTRVSLAASLSRLSDSDSANSQDSGRLPGFDITVGLQGTGMCVCCCIIY